MAERGSGPHQFSQSQAQTTSASSTTSTTPQQQQQQVQQPQPPMTHQQQQAAALQQAQLSLMSKDVNHVNICRVGQEVVHDLVGKAQEIFQLLSPKSLQLNMSAQQYQEKKQKLEETLSHVSMQFRKLHLIHDRVVEISAVPEELSPQQLVPEVGVDIVEPLLPTSNPEVYNKVVEQHREIVQQVRKKNQELKEVIDQIRTIIWEINTMIAMRRT